MINRVANKSKFPIVTDSDTEINGLWIPPEKEEEQSSG